MATRAGAPIALFPPVAGTGAVAATGFRVNGDATTGNGGSLVVAPKVLDPKREEPGVGAALASNASGSPATGSGFGMRLNAPGLKPENRLAAGVVAGFVVASSAGGFVSGFAVVPSEKPPKFNVGTGGATGTAEAVAEVLLRAVPFAINNGGVFGLAIADGVALAL